MHSTSDYNMDCKEREILRRCKKNAHPMRTNQAQPELVKRLALGATDFDQPLVLRIT